jgi:hypothetical protein
VTTCDYPRFAPSRNNPTGGCGRVATMAAPLGDTGRWLPLCGKCAQHRVDAVPLDQIPEQ